MNKRTLIVVLLAVMETVIMAIDIALLVMGKISATTFWTVLIILCLASAPLFFFAARGITAGIKSPQEQAAEEGDKINLDELILPRTLESTIIEVVSLAILVAAWWIVGAHHFLHDDTVSVGGVTLMVISLLGDAYFPADTYLFGKLHNLTQVNMSARFKRVMAVLFAITSLLKVLTWLNTPALEYVCLAVLLLTYIAFRIVLHRSR